MDFDISSATGRSLYAYYFIRNPNGTKRISGGIHRQPLPDWIPEDIGRKYPEFPPMPSQSFPIVSNWYALAKLAEETGQTDDLLSRLKEAHQKQRAGSAEALAIVLAVSGQPVRELLLRDIVKRMDATLPDGDQAKTSLPLAVMQLAATLAEESGSDGWARELTDKFQKHASTRSRRYMIRWISQFQYERGWLEEAKLKPADSLEHWLASSSAPVGNYADGLTPSIWVTHGQSQLNHVCGISNDRFWFRYPLAGDFEFQVELSDCWSTTSRSASARDTSAL